MSLLNISTRARVTDVKVKGSAKTGTEVIVSVAFPRSALSQAQKAALIDYDGYHVDCRLTSWTDEDGATPHQQRLDDALAHANGASSDDAGRHERPERMRPLAGEECKRCSRVIAEDEASGFEVPVAGAPMPLCGDCFATYEQEQREETADGEPEPVTDEQLVALLALVDLEPDGPLEWWTTEEREQVAVWAAAVHVNASDHDDVVVPERPEVLDRMTRAFTGETSADSTEPASDAGIENEAVESEATAQGLTLAEHREAFGPALDVPPGLVERDRAALEAAAAAEPIGARRRGRSK